jgi:predicted amino acid racemase
MSEPRVTIDLDIIERNARAVTEACARYGVSVFGVTKGTCGTPQVAAAMLRGGVIGIGESRFENIQRLRRSGLTCRILLLRSPPLSRVDETVTGADISLNSELAVIEALSHAAVRRSRVHEIVLMVDLGDLREGIWPDDLLPTVAEILRLPGVRLVGLGTNLTCFGAVLPSEANMAQLAGCAAAIESEFGVGLTYVSGGNSSSLPFLLEGRMPPGVNNLRIGESILQGGRDTFFDQPWEELDRNAFLLEGELLEVKLKPSVPIGESGVDAFGGHPVFVDRGERLRGIVNLGREDVVVDALIPRTAGVEVLGASSDHLIVDVTDVRAPPRVGDLLGFQMGYAALLAAMTSEYVEKQLMFEKPLPRRERIRLSIEPGLDAVVDELQIAARVEALGLSVTEPGGDAITVRLASSHLHTADLLAEVAAAHVAAGLIWLDAGAGVMAPGGPVLTPGQLSPENVVLVGTRSVTSEQAEAIRGTAVSDFTIVDVDALGMAEVMRRALRIATNGTEGFIVSYDTSVTDIPGRPEGANGLSARETHQAMEAIAQAAGLLALNVVGLDAAVGASANALVGDFIMSCLGRTIL